MNNKTKSVVCFRKDIFFALLFFSVFLAPNTAGAYVPGDTINHTYSHTYSGDPWGTYYAEVGSWLNNGGCSYVGGNVFGSSAVARGDGPASVSATCSFTAGPVGTTYTLQNWLQINGGGWTSPSTATYTVSAPTCTSFTYSLGQCQPNGTQTKTVLTSSPSGCTGGSPETSQACTYTLPTGNYDGATYNFYLCANGNSVCSSPVNVQIVRATPSITWANPANITYGTALSGTQLNATANVTGTFSYSPGAGTVLNAAAGPSDVATLSVTFTPSDTTNYNTASQNASIYVSKADQTISFGALGNKTYGDPAFSVSASASSGLGVSFSSLTTGVCTVSGSTVTLQSTGTCTVRASQGGNSNYNAAATVDQSFSVSVPAPSQPVVTTSTGSCGGNINLSYSGGSGATSFKLHRNPDANNLNQWGQITSAQSLGALPSSQSGLSPGTTYAYQVEAINASGNSYSAVTNATASASCFDYSLGVPFAPPTLVEGNQAVVYVDSTLISSQTQGVTIALPGLPSGVTYSVTSPTSKSPSAEYEITLTATGSATTGTFPITVTGSPLGKTTSFNLTVAAPTVNASLSLNPNPASIIPGQQASFVTSVTGSATGAVTYGTPSCGTFAQNGSLLANDGSGNFTCSFSTTGDKTINIVATRQGVSSTASKVITVSAPPNTLTVQSSLDGTPVEGAFVNVYDGTYSGTYQTTTTLPPTTSNITNTIDAPKKLNGNSFISWSGCDSVSRTWSCNITVANGSTKTISANYATTAYRATLTNISLTAAQIEGDRYTSDPSKFVDNARGSGVWLVATLANTGSIDVQNVWVDYLIDEGRGYITLGPCSSANPPCYYSDTRSSVDSLPSGASTKVYAHFNLPIGAYLVRAYADQPSADSPTGMIPETNENDNYTGGSVPVSAPPALPPSPCIVNFANNTTSETNQDTRTHADITITGCDPARWINLFMDGGAGINTTAERVLDIVSGFWRPFDMSRVGSDDDHFNVQAKAANNTSNNAGGGINFGGHDSQGVPLLPLQSGGIDYVAYQGPRVGLTPEKYYIDFGSNQTSWGRYDYHIQDALEGGFVCYSNIYTHYDAPSGQFVSDAVRNSTIGFRRLAAEISTCFNRSTASEGSLYYIQSCGGGHPDATTIQCPNGTVSPSITVTNTCTGSGCGGPLNGLHTLNVKSTLDNASSPNDIITQVGSAVAVNGAGVPLSPTVTVNPLEGGDFGGVTDYTRTAERNFKVTLHAPDPHSAVQGTFTKWTGDCDNYQGGQDCTVKFIFDQNGGQTKTVTASYSSALPTPTITLAEPGLCGAKVRLTWDSVAGADGYRVFRSATSGGTYSDITAPTAGYVPPVGQSPDYTDVTGVLTPSTPYFYQVSAYAGTGGVRKSASSASKSGTASELCPDLIVNSITATKGGVPTTTIIDGDSIRFSAVIKNQGGATPPLTAPGFQNQFTIDGDSTYFRTIPLNGLAGGASVTITTPPTQPWPASNTTNAPIAHSLVVCADQPPLSKGVVDETGSGLQAETNNCTTLNFSVLPTLSATLEAGKADNTSYGSSLIINYEDAANLRWTIGGNPTNCNATPNTDWTGSKVPQSYEVVGNHFPIPYVAPTKLQFNYQLDCNR